MLAVDLAIHRVEGLDCDEILARCCRYRFIHVEDREGSTWLSRDGDAAIDRHYAAHPEDRDANIATQPIC
jgi:hypothetical protein